MFKYIPLEKKFIPVFNFSFKIHKRELMQTKINCLEKNLHLTGISLTRCEKVIMLTASLLK